MYVWLLYILCSTIVISLLIILLMFDRNVSLLLVVAMMDLPKPLQEAAIEHAKKEITQQDMSESLDSGKKGKRLGRRKSPLMYWIWDLRN